MISDKTIEVNKTIPPSSHAVDPIYDNSSIERIRRMALQVIRAHMPITTLFTPQLQINLKLFVQNQIFIQKMAAFLLQLPGEEALDKEMLKKHFESSPLFAEFKTLFTNSDLYLDNFLQDSIEALQNKNQIIPLIPALKRRVFTIKNAITAEICPDNMATSLKKNGLPIPSLEALKETGHNFIQESLRLHLQAQARDFDRDFKETLILVARQLLPFVEEITKSYLKENNLKYPAKDLLEFRNSTGYNHHGLVAAMILEACLGALGYETRIMQRSDLEPKVTLATAHCLAVVIGPEGERYIVDPTYMQFHKDICDEKNIPKDPLLVLKEEEVEEYVEHRLMSYWRAVFCRVERDDPEMQDQLIRGDRYLAYVLNKVQMEGLEVLKPPSMEAWVKDSLIRVWHIPTYSPILSNAVFQNIFNGAQPSSPTYNLVKSLNVAELTVRPSKKEIDNRLVELAKDPEMTHQNSKEALSLIAQLPSLERKKHVVLFDTDPRLQIFGGLDISLDLYYREIKKLINPSSRDLKAVYGCAGADCTSILESTDANDLTFVDLTKISLANFRRALRDYLQTEGLYPNIDVYLAMNKHNYVSNRSRYCGSSNEFTQGQHTMCAFEHKVFFDLRELGVDLNQATLDEKEGSVVVSFPWQYYGEAISRTREITFITADITKPDLYPPLLKGKLEAGIDIFFMKGSFLAPKSYDQFLPGIAKNINSGGYLMTSDKTFLMETVDPMPYLEAENLVFEEVKTAIIQTCEDLLEPPFSPLVSVPSLEIMRDNRICRTAGSGISYWVKLVLRQKTHTGNI